MKSSGKFMLYGSFITILFDKKGFWSLLFESFSILIIFFENNTYRENQRRSSGK